MVTTRRQAKAKQIASSSPASSPGARHPPDPKHDHARQLTRVEYVYEELMDNGGSAWMTELERDFKLRKTTRTQTSLAPAWMPMIETWVDKSNEEAKPNKIDSALDTFWAISAHNIVTHESRFLCSYPQRLADKQQMKQVADELLVKFSRWPNHRLDEISTVSGEAEILECATKLVKTFRDAALSNAGLKIPLPMPTIIFTKSLMYNIAFPRITVHVPHINQRTGELLRVKCSIGLARVQGLKQARVTALYDRLAKADNFIFVTASSEQQRHLGDSNGIAFDKAAKRYPSGLPLSPHYAKTTQHRSSHETAEVLALLALTMINDRMSPTADPSQIIETWNEICMGLTDPTLQRLEGWQDVVERKCRMFTTQPHRRQGTIWISPGNALKKELCDFHLVVKDRDMARVVPIIVGAINWMSLYGDAREALIRAARHTDITNYDIEDFAPVMGVSLCRRGDCVTHWQHCSSCNMFRLCGSFVDYSVDGSLMCRLCSTLGDPTLMAQVFGIGEE